MAFLTDPSIPLQVKTPNLAQVYLQAQQIKGAQQEQQLRSLSLAQATQSMKDEADVRAAYEQGQGDPQKTVAALQATNPKAAEGLKMQFAKTAADQAKTAADQQKLTLENNLKKVQGLGQLANAATPENWAQIKQQAVTQFGADPNAIPDQYDPNVVKQYQLQSMTAEQKIQAALQQQNAQETARHNTQTEATAAATQAETAKYHGIEAKQRGQEIGIQGARLQLERQKQSTDDDASIETQAQQIAKGELPAPPQSRMNPRNTAVMRRALEINPNLSTALYTTKQNFKTKGDAQNVVQLTTALDHLDSALENSQKVGFAPFLGHNATANDAAYNQDIKLFTQEAGKLVANKAITQHEYEDLISGMKSSRQGIRDAALKETVKLMGGKVEGIMQKYKSGTGMDLDPKEYFDQATQDRLSKYGIGGQGTPAGKQGPPPGATHIVPGSDGKMHYTDGKNDLGVAQ